MSRYYKRDSSDHPLAPARPRHFPHFSDDDDADEHASNFHHGLGTEQLKGLEDNDDIDEVDEKDETDGLIDIDALLGRDSPNSERYVVRRKDNRFVRPTRSSPSEPSINSESSSIRIKGTDTRGPFSKSASRRSRSRSRSRSKHSSVYEEQNGDDHLGEGPQLALARVALPRFEKSTGNVDDQDEIAYLRRKNAELEAKLAENNIPRTVTPPPASLGYRSVTIYELGIDSERYYLDEPQWVIGDSNVPVLLAYKGISSLPRYLDNHPEISFTFMRGYQSRPPKDLSQITDSDGVLRAPKPDVERLELIAGDMIEALENFIKLVPDFADMFPKFGCDQPISAPFQVMYYCSRFLDRCLKKLDTLHAKLVQQVFDAVKRKYGRHFSLADTKAKNGLVNKRSLPFLIRPGDIIVECDGALTQAYQAVSWLEKPDSYHAESAADPDRATTEPGKVGNDEFEPAKKSVLSFEVSAAYFTFDGDFHRERKKLKVKLTSTYDDDDVEICTLNIYPLVYAPGTISQDLHRRGSMLWQCRNHRLVNYTHNTGSHLENASDRFMVDMKTYRKMNPPKVSDRSVYGDRFRKYYTSAQMASDDFPPMDELVTFPALVFGYNLRTKKWRKLSLHYVVNVEWNKVAFEHLVAEDKTKTLIKALVTNQLAESESTDVIDAKGGGLVLLLHGGPGTGKTFTAEGVAEFAEKPLLRVTCGDAGVEAREVERYLQNVFRLGHLWDCVVLLDEADVFLEERDIRDLNRNALVSVFLRILEYYQGILILTSNRVGTFDEAFKSRIQLALYYQKLGKPERQKIWRNFMTRVRDMPTSNMDYDDIMDHLEELAEYKLNGREIRNVVTTARQLARFEGGKLRYSHVKDALDVTCKFGVYLTTLFKKTDEQRLKEAQIRS